MRQKTPEEKVLLRSEFIGREVSVRHKNNSYDTNFQGEIIDETKNTFRIRTDSGVKIVPKTHNIFSIENHRISGGDILFRPEDRIKKIRCSR